MNLPFKFARRYIFSQKSTNAINLISAISVLGISLGSMALIVIMSVFNGFEGLLGDLIGNFKPDIKVTVIEGKVFEPDSSKIVRLEDIDGVTYISKTLQEVVLLEYNGVQNIGFIKGVDDNFREVTAIDTCLSTGEYKTYDAESDVHFAVIGAALEYALGIPMGGMSPKPLTVYMPKRNKKTYSATSKPFKQRKIYPVGVYTIMQSDYDNYVVTNLPFVQELTTYPNGEISALEIRLAATANVEAVQKQITEIMGEEFEVKNRYQQDEALYKITNMEKWFAFIVFAFTLVLVAFNMVGALWMLVLEKKEDIATLKAMGADSKLVRNIFLAEGFVLSLIGVSLGCVLAIILCLVQQEYGLVKLAGSDEFIVTYYPVDMYWLDFVQVIFTVLTIGGIAAWIPAYRASKIRAIIHKK